MLRNLLYDLKIFKSTEFDIPVISIGNITVGGTGKTPHIEYLVNLLKNRYRVATLSRGYKRKTKGFRMVETGSTVPESGDEPLQIKRKFPGITVAVCENRVKGVNELLKKSDPPDLVLLDDAFQHRRITPDINIVLVDYSRPVKYDHLLPAGRLREGIVQLRRANIIIVTKCPEVLTPIARKIFKKDLNIRPYQSLYFTRLVYGQLQPVFKNQPERENEIKLDETGVLLVTGIASPEKIREYLTPQVAELNPLVFPDHHYFSASDLDGILAGFKMIKFPAKIIVTTEKDAVRFRDRTDIPDEIRENLYYLPVTIRFTENEESSFDQRIINYVGKNKGNRELHQRKNKQ